MWLWEDQDSLLGPFSFVLVLLLVVMCSPFKACVLTGSLYILLRFFFELVMSHRWTLQVFKPRDCLPVIAHRGSSHNTLENTVEAIQQTAKNRATGVELDIEFTSDGVPVLMQDDTADRTTDLSSQLRDLTFEQVRKLNPEAIHRLRNEFPDERIPSLKEPVTECLHHNLAIFFYVKGHADVASTALKNIYTEFPQLYNDNLVCSFFAGSYL